MESIAVAQLTQSPAQRKIECAHWIIGPRIGFIQPISDGAFAVPALTNCVRFETGAVAQGAQFLDRTNHPAAVAFHHVVAESVETDFLQKPARITDELGINERSAMTEVRHVAESCAVPGLVAAWMKTFPITRKSAALRFKLRPARLAVDGIQFLCIAATVVIEHQVRIHLESQRVSGLN